MIHTRPCCAEICVGYVHRGMRIPGELPFISGYQGGAALARTHVRTLQREQALCAAELRVRVQQELPKLVQGRRARIANLLAGAEKPALSHLAHLLRSRAAQEQVLLAKDQEICATNAAAFKRFGNAAHDTPSPDDVADLVSEMIDGDDGSSDSNAGEDGSDDEGPPADVVANMAYDGETEGFVQPASAPAACAVASAVASEAPPNGPAAAVTPPPEERGAAPGVVNLTEAIDEALVEPGRHRPDYQTSGFTWKGISVQDSQKRRYISIPVCEIAHEGLSMRLTGKDMRTLQAKQWLNSEIMIAHAIMTQVWSHFVFRPTLPWNIARLMYTSRSISPLSSYLHSFVVNKTHRAVHASQICP